MRTEMMGLTDKKLTFTATFWCYGTMHRKGIVGRTILLKSLRNLSGRLLADHIWINYTAGFDALGEFHKGESVRFTAIVAEYVKGYFGDNIDERFKHPYSIDFRLKFPRNVERLAQWI